LQRCFVEPSIDSQSTPAKAGAGALAATSLLITFGVVALVPASHAATPDNAADTPRRTPELDADTRSFLPSP